MAGKVTNECGFSDVTYIQSLLAQMRATDSQAPSQFEADEFGMGGVAGAAWGEDDHWSTVIASPFETRSYRFRTSAAFRQGVPVLIEGGITHITDYQTNDESVTTNADVDLRLTRIEVRSCQDVFL